MSLERRQLEKAVNDIVYLAMEMFAYYAWNNHVQPRFARLAGASPFHNALVRNAVIEAQLMFYRKLNEIFRPVDHRHPTDLKSQLFGYEATGGFLNDEEIDELHKRVAHPTTLQAVHGSVCYDMYSLSYRALRHVIPFLKFLSERFHEPDSTENRKLRTCIENLRNLWEEWSSRVPLEKRKALDV